MGNTGKRDGIQRDTEGCYLGPCGMNRNCALSDWLFVLMLAFHWACSCCFADRRVVTGLCAPPSGQKPLLLIGCHSSGQPFLPLAARDGRWEEFAQHLSGEQDAGFLGFSFFLEGPRPSSDWYREVDYGYRVQVLLPFWPILHFASKIIDMYKQDLILITINSFSRRYRKGATRKHFISMES